MSKLLCKKCGKRVDEKDATTSIIYFSKKLEGLAGKCNGCIRCGEEANSNDIEISMNAVSNIFSKARDTDFKFKGIFMNGKVHYFGSGDTIFLVGEEDD